MPRRPRRKGGTLKDGERRQLARASRHEPAAPPRPSDRPLLLCDGGSRGTPGTAAIAAVRCDSQLAVKAIRAGAPVAAPVLDLARGFRSVRWVWHPRGENEAADALVRELLWPTS